MSKRKSRRQNRLRPAAPSPRAALAKPPVVRSEVGLRPPATVSPQAAAPVTPSISAKPAASDVRAEYRYVVADLKRIAVVAVSMLALLVVLALILT